jgi:hypothetical protein
MRLHQNMRQIKSEGNEEMREMMHLRQATKDDIAQIASLHALSWRDAYQSILDPAFLAGPVESDRLAVWNARLSTPRDDRQVAVAVEQGVLVGFVCVFGDEDPKWGCASIICMLPLPPAAVAQALCFSGQQHHGSLTDTRNRLCIFGFSKRMRSPANSMRDWAAPSWRRASPKSPARAVQQSSDITGHPRQSFCVEYSFSNARVNW